jgi:hypothetical protein
MVLWNKDMVKDYTIETSTHRMSSSLDACMHRTAACMPDERMHAPQRLRRLPPNDVAPDQRLQLHQPAQRLQCPPRLRTEQQAAAATKTPWRRIATAAAACVATLRLRVRDLAWTAPYSVIRTVYQGHYGHNM